MTVLYADTSAVVRAYFSDEDDHRELSRLLLGGTEPVVTSELTRLELASAVAAAHRAHRLPHPATVLAQFDVECADEGAFTLLRLGSPSLIALARQLVADHPLRTLDALHLATALTDAVAIAAGEPVAIVTRDRRMADAARALGCGVL